ncbi:DUF1330 domain-containing protein [Amycolatopsis mongoliensis]|uniref:DUF1330 domain-containing protein n=1 Tax=Amycolatopsis mongoliensis TaxID=715475 RepID=A0A9Y2NHI4_9PSEU|nr:DUF1330 domain-containing protein [Amycolatopsis sp. 4-36]WIY05866.1 DUF1330 domain-containing protein [Amycolatopsis sp. 4-36]
MTAYVISEVEILDEAQAQRYRELAQASIEAHGGRYLARGATPTVLEGSSERKVIIVEFPDRETAERWYRSDDYAAALKIRATALERRLLLVDGVGSAEETQQRDRDQHHRGGEGVDPGALGGGEGGGAVHGVS